MSYYMTAAVERETLVESQINIRDQTRSRDSLLV